MLEAFLAYNLILGFSNLCSPTPTPTPPKHLENTLPWCKGRNIQGNAELKGKE